MIATRLAFERPQKADNSARVRAVENVHGGCEPSASYCHLRREKHRPTEPHSYRKRAGGLKTGPLHGTGEAGESRLRIALGPRFGIMMAREHGLAADRSHI